MFVETTFQSLPHMLNYTLFPEDERDAFKQFCLDRKLHAIVKLIRNRYTVQIYMTINHVETGPSVDLMAEWVSKDHNGYIPF